MRRMGCVLTGIGLSFTVGAVMNAQNPGQADVQQIAERADVYAYPLVLLQETMRELPPNRLIHVSAFPDASFRLIVRPNADTLYTNAWIDVAKEPMLLHVANSGGLGDFTFKWAAQPWQVCRSLTADAPAFGSGLLASRDRGGRDD